MGKGGVSAVTAQVAVPGGWQQQLVSDLSVRMHLRQKLLADYASMVRRSNEEGFTSAKTYEATHTQAHT